MNTMSGSGPRDDSSWAMRFIEVIAIVWRVFFFFSSRRRHTRFDCDWSSDVCSSDLLVNVFGQVIPILDWYHLAEHVHKAANGLYGQGTPQAAEWARRIKGELWEGDRKSVV